MLDFIGIHCAGFHKNPTELHWKTGGVHCVASFKLFVTKRYCGASSQLRHCCHQKADDGRFLNSCAFQLKPDCSHNWHCFSASHNMFCAWIQEIEHPAPNKILSVGWLPLFPTVESEQRTKHSVNDDDKTKQILSLCRLLMMMRMKTMMMMGETNSIVVPCSYVSRLSPNRQYVLCLHSAYFLYWHKKTENTHVCKSNKIFNGLCLWIKTQGYIYCMITNQ